GLAADPADAAEASPVRAEAPAYSAPDSRPAAEVSNHAEGNLGTGHLGSPDDCPACGCSELRTLFSATDRLYRTTSKYFQIVECRKCRLIRLHPQPSPVELRDYYPPNYWFVPESTAADRLEQWYRRFVLRDHLHFVERALEESEEDGLVLDVGCGGGLFLQMLAERKKARVVGLDFS